MSRHEITKCDICTKTVNPKDMVGEVIINPTQSLDHEELRFQKDEVCYECAATILKTIESLKPQQQ